MNVLAPIALVCAGVPAAVFCVNLRFYRQPPLLDGSVLPPVSILIPARNEEETIGACLRSALRTSGVPFEIIVMDDSSTDRTAAIVLDVAASSPGEIELASAAPLPAGWNGKQHACWQLAGLARNPLLCFIDADVRVAPDAVARMAQFTVATRSGLVSGFPRQITVTWLEQMLLPLIHFVLLGFLPLAEMRKNPTNPGYAAGCGQFLMVDREAYFASGGHAAIRDTMHDGIRLPRLLRAHGHRTDLADLTGLVSCRMYTGASQVWHGLAKNAVEGMGSPRAIVPATAILLLGQVVPFVLLVQAVRGQLTVAASVCALVASVAALLPRFLSVKRFRQPLLAAVLHPLAILVLLSIQWYALGRHLAGAPTAWRARDYPAR